MTPPISILDRIASFKRPMLAEDVAECLGVTSDQVYRYARKNGIPHYKLGKNVRFDPAEIYRWYESSRCLTSW